MKRAAVRVMPALGAVLGLGAAAQLTLWFAALGPVPTVVSLVAVLGSIGAAWLGLLLLRRALQPLGEASPELRALQRPYRADPALVSPAPLHDHAPPDELFHLRRRLRARLRDAEQLREQAAQASAYKTGFLRSVRHELRTPLHAILGFAEVLLSDLEGPLTSSQRENVVVIERTARRLQDLFDEIIELATVVAGQLEVRREAVDAAALLEEVREELEVQRGDRPVHIRVDVADGLTPIVGDPYRLKQLVRGIAGHALSVTTGPLLVLSASAAASDAGLQLAVRDPSRKLSEAEIAGLLSRGESASRRKGLDEASRLRLAIWQQLAQLYGGTLSLHSDERGTTYALELPAWSPP